MLGTTSACRGQRITDSATAWGSTLSCMHTFITSIACQQRDLQFFATSEFFIVITARRWDYWESWASVYCITEEEAAIFSPVPGCSAKGCPLSAKVSQKRYNTRTGVVSNIKPLCCGICKTYFRPPPPTR